MKIKYPRSIIPVLALLMASLISWLVVERADGEKTALVSGEANRKLRSNVESVSRIDTKTRRAPVAISESKAYSVHYKEFSVARRLSNGQDRYEKTLESFRRARDTLSGVDLIEFVRAVENECPDELKGWLYDSARQRILATPEDRRSVVEYLKSNVVDIRLVFALGNEAGASRYPIFQDVMDSLRLHDEKSVFAVAYQRRVHRFDPRAAIGEVVEFAESSGDAGVIENFVKLPLIGMDWDYFIESVTNSEVATPHLLEEMERIRERHTVKRNSAPSDR